MIDIAKELADLEIGTAPSPRGDWTQERLRKFVADRLPNFVANQTSNATFDDGIRYDGPCPFCGQGGAAIWLRHGTPCFLCFHQNTCNQPRKFTFGDVARKVEKRLEIISAAELPAKYPHSRPHVVRGLIRRGDVANFIGGPKARKSFLAMQLALCVASGNEFLSWATVQGRVLMLDNELRGDDLCRRMMAMATAMGFDFAEVAQNLDMMPLRGKLADLTTIRDQLSTLPSDTYALIVADALYKLMPASSEENNNTDMTRAYELLDGVAEQHNCASAGVQHASKGNQNKKAVSDVGAGAGAQSRSADAHLVIRPHEDNDTVVMDGILRSLPPIEPLCLTFEYPIWRVASDKDPSAIAATNRKPVVTLQEFLGTMPKTPTPKKAVLAKARNILGITVAQRDALYETALCDGYLEESTAQGRSHAKLINRTARPFLGNDT